MSILSAIPLAILPIVEAVAGAINTASAHQSEIDVAIHVPSRWAKNSLMTGLLVKAERVMGVINSFPAGVITTCTSAPCFISPRMI